jgi:hypothetical protein
MGMDIESADFPLNAISSTREEGESGIPQI